MSKGRVVVDDELRNIKSALEEQGYEVLGMDALGQNPDAVIVSGIDDNLMGMQGIQVKAPVISASGMNANQVINELNKKIMKTK
ncbi:hypothetical protein BBF96_13270 [Anoxybacter fermentans]|uniref:YkuS family protein n=1 Tax=Anoxybacter fermentans TaxID=1323375 RepID=A0A3Q9HSG5_9FIRM|nr:YkuS family protein [Anoxybacter fermentans]AZR74286.1 hypothetical protein BBF96_13270 [Anoxybacter fermentans]